MSGLKILYNLILKDTVKGSGSASGILSIGKDIRKLADKKFQRYVMTAQKQGVDLDKLSEQEIKYMLELNKPKAPQVFSNEEAYKFLNQFLSQGKKGKGEVVKFPKDKIKDINKAKSRPPETEIIKGIQTTRGLGDLFPKQLEKTVTVRTVIEDIKKLDPMDSMKETNRVLKGEGKYKNLSKADREKIASDESVTDHIFERNIIDETEDFAYGGVAGMLGERTGFSKGKLANLARRNFMKLLGGAAAGIGALKTGAFKFLGKEAAPVAKEVVTTPNVAGKPAWFDALVNKVILKGEDVTKKFATKERELVNTKQINDFAEATVYRDLDTNTVRVNFGSKLKIDPNKPYEKGNISRAVNDPDQIDLIVKGPEDIEPTLIKTKEGFVQRRGGKTKAEFEAYESEPRVANQDGDIEFDGERMVNNVDDLMQDVSVLEEFATGKKLTGKKAIKAKKKQENFEKFTHDTSAQSDYIVNKYGEGDFASGGIARMLGE
jgi:hypothetical protein